MENRQKDNRTNNIRYRNRNREHQFHMRICVFFWFTVDYRLTAHTYIVCANDLLNVFADIATLPFELLLRTRLLYFGHK